MLYGTTHMGLLCASILLVLTVDLGLCLGQGKGKFMVNQALWRSFQ